MWLILSWVSLASRQSLVMCPLFSPWKKQYYIRCLGSWFLFQFFLWLYFLPSYCLCDGLFCSASGICCRCWLLPCCSMLKTCWPEVYWGCNWPWLLLPFWTFLPLVWYCLFWFCSSSLLRRSLSDLQYFSNSVYSSCIVLGFSRARWAAKAPMRRPLIAASIATSSGTFGAFALSCTNL